MKIYAISGLGADERVFNFLSLEHELIPIIWISPRKKEALGQYAERLIDKYRLRNEKEVIILGLSFGGLIASEISQRIQPKLTILISSIEESSELPSFFRFIGKTKLIKAIPKLFLKPPRLIAQYLFGAKNIDLLNDILRDTDLDFTKWAMNELLKWQNETKLKNVFQIAGSKDKLFPPKGRNDHIVKGGGHFMIVDRAKEISDIINRLLASG